MSDGASREKRSGLAGEERFDRQDRVVCAALSRRQGTAIRQLFDKTAARDFYEKAKQEQKTGRFFPERYHRAVTRGLKIIDGYSPRSLDARRR